MPLQYPLEIRKALQLICIALFLVLYYPVYSWLLIQLSNNGNWVHIIACLGVVVLFLRAFIAHWPFNLPCFHWRGASFLLLTLSSALYLMNEYLTFVRIFSASLFVLGLYAYSGFYLLEHTWKKLFIPMALLIVLLPFEGHLDTYLGFPLRYCIAQVSLSVLGGINALQVTAEAVLIVENRAALVDLDCSGLKGLWAGLIFYFLLSWVERKTITVFWFIGLLLFFLCLLFFNVLRIITLVVLDLILNLPNWAAALHVPLGILGFIVSCALAWVFFNSSLMVSHQISSLDEGKPIGQKRIVEVDRSQGRQLLILLCVFVGAIALYTPKPTSNQVQSYSPIQLPLELHPKSLALPPKEQGFFDRNFALAEKFSFQFGGVNGSILFVRSAFWKSQHDPRNCYSAGGHIVDYEDTWMIGQGQTVKHLLLDGGKYSAIYWFQSAEHRTSDFTTRVMWGWQHSTADWLMVSVLFEKNIEQSEINPLLTLLNTSIQNILMKQHIGVLDNE